MFKKNTKLLLISGTFLFCSGLFCHADSPGWLGRGAGPERSATSWEPQAIQEQANVKWRANVKSGYSSFCIKNNRLFTMGNDKSSNTDIVYCLDTNTGKEIWRHTYKCNSGSYPGPRCTPTFDDGLIYTVSRQGDVFCLSAKDGNVRWHKNITREFGAKPPKWGHSASAVVEGDVLLLNACTNGLALNKKTGSVIWASDPGVCGYATPVPYNRGGTKRILLFGEKGLYDVDFVSGRKEWFFPWKTQHDVNAADPILWKKHVFISSGYGTGGALLNISGSKPREVWRNKVMHNHFSTCMLLNGYLYGISDQAGRGELICMDFRTGDKQWQGSTGFGNLIAVGNRLLVINERGKLHILKANPKAQEILAAQDGLLSRTCWTPPVFADNHIYCRNEKGDVVCIDVSNK